MQVCSCILVTQTHLFAIVVSTAQQLYESFTPAPVVVRTWAVGKASSDAMLFCKNKKI